MIGPLTILTEVIIMHKTSETFLVPIASLAIAKRKGSTAKDLKTTALTNRLDEKSLSLNDIKLIMETLPDLQYAKKIKVASILSPKDITIPKLWMRLEGVKGQPDPGLIPYIENHFRNVYPLEKQLFNILGNILFDHGSHSLAVIPPSEIDRIIQQAMMSGESFESMSEKNPLSLKLVNPKADLDFLKGLNITVTDNVNDIKKASSSSRANTKGILDILAGESIRMANSNGTKKDSVHFTVPTVEDKRENNDPVVIYFPPDSIAPVFDPTDPSKHLGYYIALDTKSGMPITKLKDSKLNDQLDKQLSELGALGDKLNAQFSGLPIKTKELETTDGREDFIRLFEDKVAEQLSTSLKDNVYGNVEVSNSSEVYRLLLFKALKKESVKMVYLPAELVTYFAFEHDSKGMGISLIEKTKLMSSLRTLVMMSDVLANISNSTPITEVEITLDEDDPDQTQTVETILNNIARIDKQRSPVGIFNVSDIVTAFRKANTRIKVSGGDVFPNTATSFSDTQRNVARVDQDLIEFLAKQQHSGIDVPSELIDRAMEGEFAVSTHTTNHLWAMTNMLTQMDFINDLNDHVHKYIRFSPRVLSKIEEFKGDLTVEEILGALTVVLPKHDSASIDSITENFSAYSDLVDDIVEQYISNDLLRDLVPDSDDLDDIGDVVLNQIASYFKRQWLINNNVLPEVTGKLFKDETDDFKLSDVIGEFNDDMIESIKQVVDSAIKASAKADKKTRRAKARAEKQREKGDAPEEEETPPVTDEQGAANEGAVEEAAPGTGEEETAPVPGEEEQSDDGDDFSNF